MIPSHGIHEKNTINMLAGAGDVELDGHRMSSDQVPTFWIKFDEF